MKSGTKIVANGLVGAILFTFADASVMAQNLLDRSGGTPRYVAPYFGGPSFGEPREAPPRPRPPRPKPAPAANAAPTGKSAPGTPAANAAPGTKPSNPTADDNPPPYEPQLLRLSELLGALTYLQGLCGDQNGQIWRAKMSELMDAETQSQVRRERLAGAYNRGFNGYELSYRQCTPNAQAIITRFLDESGKIARDVTHKYGTS